MPEEFKWTDGNVWQFAIEYQRHCKVPNVENTYRFMEQFKGKHPEAVPAVPNWRILEIKGQHSKAIYRPNAEGLWVNDNNCGFFWAPGDECDCDIYSIQRLTDGEIFQKGEQIEDIAGARYRIRTFQIDPGDGQNMIIHTECAATLWIWAAHKANVSKKSEPVMVLTLPAADIEKLSQFIRTL